MKDLMPLLLALNFPLRFEYKSHPLNGYIDDPADVPEPTKEYKEPTYWEVKEWLWEKQGIRLKVEYVTKRFRCIVFGMYVTKIPKWTLSKTFLFDSPIASEIQGIKEAIIHLHKQIK